MNASTRALGILRWFSFKMFLSELLGKRWMEPAVPFLVLLACLAFMAAITPEYLSIANLQDLSRQFAEFGLVALAMALVVMSGGIDLSVGSNFAAANFAALMVFNIYKLPVPVVLVSTLAVGAFIGACNGLMIGVLKARAFLVTLVSMIIIRSIVMLASEKYAVLMATNTSQSDLWDYIGDGSIVGVPVNVAILALVCLIGSVMLTRSRWGWHLIAIGGARRSARNAGIPIRTVVFFTYVIGGALCGLSGFLYAARQNSSGSDTGQAFEVLTLTAVVLGGVAMAGGRGSVGRAIIGAGVMMVLTNGSVRNGVSGEVNSLVLGAVLLLAVGMDVKWSKNKAKAIQKIYLSPARCKLPPCPLVATSAGTTYQLNDDLSNAQAIGLDRVDGPEDVILDLEGRLYAGTRDGRIVRFSGPGYKDMEVFARTGGRPLGMAFDRQQNLVVCIAGMGLYMVGTDRKITKLTDETNRTWYSPTDDSRLRLADDLDIAPDGKIYFSEATRRYDMAEWQLDGIECRGNGRIICYDPATRGTRTVLNNLIFPNGICVTHDGQAILFAQTWACTLSRYWIAGPRAGDLEMLIADLPGYPDNINRASDGNYWVALVGMRTPSYDLALRRPGFRTRMVKTIPPDEWLCPNLNNGGAIKVTDTGEVVGSLWDPGARSHAMITSMREHRGCLYLGGVTNNRIGQIPIPGADPNWTSFASYYGAGRQGVVQ